MPGFEALLHQVVSLSYDLMPNIRSLLGNPSISALQLQMVLMAIAAGGALSILSSDRSRVVELLNSTDPPPRLLPSFEASRANMLARAGSDDVTWIALFRWGLRTLPLTPKPATNPESFHASFVVFSTWYNSTPPAQHQWNTKLLELLAALCKVVPNLPSLTYVLEQPWADGKHSELATISELIAGKSRSERAKRLLKDAVDEAWWRCLESFALSELVKLYRKYPQYADIIRFTATNVNYWDGTLAEQLTALEALDFRDERARTQSETLLKRIVNDKTAAGGMRLRIFPRLLELFAPNGSPLGKITADWVAAFLDNARRDDKAALAELYGFVTNSWATWTTPDLGVALDSLRVQVLNVHNKPGMGGGPALLDAANKLGRSASLVSSPIFREWMLPLAIKK